MKKKNPRYNLPEDQLDSLYEPDDLMTVTIERNGCMYFWGIPYKHFKSSVQYMEDPFKDEDLLALGGKLLNILVTKKYSIDFKKPTGMRKLEVVIRSSETNDKQLLHKLTSEFRKQDNSLDRDSIPGTNNNDHDR